MRMQAVGVAVAVVVIAVASLHYPTRAAAATSCTSANITQYLVFDVVGGVYEYNELPLVTGKAALEEKRTPNSMWSSQKLTPDDETRLFKSVDELRQEVTKRRVRTGSAQQQGTWYFKEGNPCDFVPQRKGFERGAFPFDGDELGAVDVEAGHTHGGSTPNGDTTIDAEVHRRRAWIEDIIRGKNIMFVGDSQVRNQFLALLPMLCNPLHMTDCGYAASLSVDSDDGASSMSCFKDAARTNRCPGARRPSNESNSTSSSPAYMEVGLLSYSNLTMKRMYRSRKERKLFWKQGLIPPITYALIPSLNASLFWLSATCGQSKTGLGRVLQHVSKYTNVGSRWLEQQQPQEEGAEYNHIEQLPQMDAILGSAGSHCTYGYASVPAFKRLAWRINTLLEPHNIPFVWMEPLNCIKGPAGETRIPEGKGGAGTSCSFLHHEQHEVSAAMARVPRNFVAPTKHITKHFKVLRHNPSDHTKRLSAAEETWQCPYVDGLHPTLKCCRDVNVIVLQTMRLAFEKWNKKDVDSATQHAVNTGSRDSADDKQEEKQHRELTDMARRAETVAVSELSEDRHVSTRADHIRAEPHSSAARQTAEGSMLFATPGEGAGHAVGAAGMVGLAVLGWLYHRRKRSQQRVNRDAQPHSG